MSEHFDDDRARKDRSPSFPFISLERALERASAAAASHKRSATRPATIGETWHYGPRSSGLIQTIAALKAYGLLEDIGRGDDRRVQLTDLAWRILHDARPGSREQGILDAALRPKLFAEYAEKWLPERPTDHHCVSELHLDRGFTQDAAKLFIKIFDENAIFTNLKSDDKLSHVDEEAEVDQAFLVRPGYAVPARIKEAALPATTLRAPEKTLSGMPYEIRHTPGHLRGSFDITSLETADELIRAINALKLLFKPAGLAKKPDNGVADNPTRQEDDD